MKDFIFVTGANGVGKTTLCNGLLAHYKATCSKLEYEYEKPSKDLFYSWVFPNGLR